MDKIYTILCIMGIVGIPIMCCGCLGVQKTAKLPEDQKAANQEMQRITMQEAKNLSAQRGIPRGRGGEGKPPGNMTLDMSGMPGVGWLRPNITEYDLDGDGLLSQEEMSAAREAMMNDSRFIERFDLDGDGILSEEEKATMIGLRNKTELV